jgi:RNA polymerase sigma-70 factor (ECF subfamily)
MTPGREPLDLEALWRAESRRVLATLIRLLGDFDRAEEALHEAFTAAAERWPREGVPARPRAWLVSAGRFKAIDALRRRARHDAAVAELATRLAEAEEPVDDDAGALADDRLRLVFTCCHPAIPPDAQVALTLREVCGLATEEIAAAFLVRPPTVAQRIVRAKARIREERIPYQVPGPEELPERLESVLRVVYLVFNEGYSASSGAAVVRPDLSAEAIRLGRLLRQLLPDPEVTGLLALMLLHEGRRAARTSPAGELVLLPDQDRARWDPASLAEGRALAARAMAGPVIGHYAIQAAIAAEHARAARAEETDWRRIAELYELLLGADRSPVVELNRAVAVAMRDGPAEGLRLLDGVAAGGALADFHLLHAARADLLRRLGRTAEAREAYARALALARQEPERRFLARRLAELDVVDAGADGC